MASDPLIEGFDASEVRAGLHLAMTIGLPTDIAEQPTFVFPAKTVDTGDDRDAEGTPMDYRLRRTKVGQDSTYQVPCAIEYVDGDGKVAGFGIVSPSKLILNLLDEDYRIIKGFSYCVVAGNRYFYRRTEPPIGLVSIALYRVHVQSDDEG